MNEKKGLLKAIEEYNNELDFIADRILKLKLDPNKNEDLDKENLEDVYTRKLYAINSYVSRKAVENLLDKIIDLC
jgi:hypothetical protein